MIEELSDARQSEIDIVKDQVGQNNEIVSTYNKFTNKLTKFETTLDGLRNKPGLNSASQSFFEVRNSTLTSSSASISSPLDYLSVSVKPGANVGATKVEVGNIAKAKEEISGSFTDRNIDVTTGSTGSSFDVGTFQIGSAFVEEVTGDSAESLSFANADYTVEGDGKGVLTTAGISNIQVIGATGQENFFGGLTGFQGSYDGGTGELTLSVDINGKTFTSNAFAADAAITGGNGIESGEVITFTDEDSEVTFDIVTSQDVLIDADPNNVTSFLNDLETAVEDQVVFQARETANFTDADVKSPLSGITSSDVKFSSDSFNLTTGEFGTISGFQIKESTGSDGEISVVIGGETFRASGLTDGTLGSVTLNSNASDKSLTIDFSAASSAVDIGSESNATDVERALDYAFGTRSLIDIDISSGDTLNDVTFAINQQKNVTGLSASIIKVDDSDFRLSFKASNVGIDNKYDIFDGSSILSGASFSETQAAEDALLTIDDIEIKRSSNTISDAIDNVTLNLIQTTPDYGGISPASINLEISRDVDTAIAGIEQFLNDFNDLRVFEAEQTERIEGSFEFTEEAILGGQTLFTSFNNQLMSRLTGIVSNSTDDDFDALTDIGISLRDFDGDDETIETKNILQFDNDELREALINDFEKVRGIFEMNVTTDSSDLSLFKSSNNFTLNDFQLSIDTSAESGQQVQLLDSNGDAVVDGDGEDIYLTLSNGKITGPSDSPLDGLEFLYSGDGNETISVSIKQGIGDQLYNLSRSFTEDEGLIDKEKEILNERNDDLNEDVTRLEDQLDSFVERLRSQFSALEAAIAEVNSILQLLEANNAAANSNN